MVVALWLGAACLPSASRAQVDELTLKAVFLERFARFIEWPDAAAMDDTTEPFVISVLGDADFGEVAQSVYATRRIRDKPVEVRRVTELSEIEGTHLLFVGRSARSRLADVLEYTRDRPILLVGDSEGFAEAGVHINFFVRESRLGFEINERMLRASPLEVSYLLLRAGNVVGNA